MAASLPSDVSDLESKNRSEIGESNNESDISVTSVSTGDLSDLDSQEMIKNTAQLDGAAIKLP